MSALARNLAFLAGICATAAAAAQSAPPPAPAAGQHAPVALAPAKPTAAPSAPPANATQPVPVDPASIDLSEQSEQLGALRRQTVQVGEELRLLTAQGEVQEQKKRLGQVTSGTAEIPELIGLEGRPGAMHAQFLAGKSLIDVMEGGWVTPDWRLERVLANGVEVSKRGSSKHQTILFGHEPISGGKNLLATPPQAVFPPPADMSGMTPQTTNAVFPPGRPSGS